jgi:hypothetical protein
MAFGKKSRFSTFIDKGAFFEAFIEYMSNEEACEDELNVLKGGRSATAAIDFSQYAGVWNRFRAFTLHGEYDKAEATFLGNPYGNEMGKPEVKSVLDDLADKTGNFHCYAMYWRLCGEDTVVEHDYALTILTEQLPDCPESKEAALFHLWWLVKNTKKKEKLRYAEKGLEFFLKPNSFVPSIDAARLITIARAVDPKSKGAVNTEFQLYERDKAAIVMVRPLVQEGAFADAIEKLGGAGDDQIRRIFLRAAREDKDDYREFISALRYLYDLTNDPVDGFYAASAVWHSKGRKDRGLLDDSMAIGLSVLDRIPYRAEYAPALLDALYLMDPYPLPDDQAVAIAQSVLFEDPDNEIALECIAIAKEQAEKSAQ